MRRMYGYGWVRRLGALLIALTCTVAAQAQTQTPSHGKVYYYYTDALHSAVVETDAAGTVLERTYYAPFGSVLNRSLRDGPGYTGHEEDAATGLVYMQQRYYDPQAARFISVDPVQVTANGGNLNRYWYANDNPYRYTDPDGRCPPIPSGCGNPVAFRTFTHTLTKTDASETLDALGDALDSFDRNTAPLNAETDGTLHFAVAPLIGGLRKLAKVVKAAEEVEDAAKAGKKFSKAKQALVDMAKADKKAGGMTEGDLQAYKDLNKEVPDPFPEDRIHGPEVHPSRGPHSRKPHGHVGPVHHIPIRKPPDKLQ